MAKLDVSGDSPVVDCGPLSHHELLEGKLTEIAGWGCNLSGGADTRMQNIEGVPGSNWIRGNAAYST